MSSDNPYKRYSMSSSSREEEKKRRKSPRRKDEDHEPKKESKQSKKQRKDQEEEYGPVGKTVVNLRKSIGHVTKTVIGRDSSDDDEKGKKNDINLAELEVIHIDDDSEEDNAPGERLLKYKLKRSEIPYFDYMPDEVIYNIFNRLYEKDMGRFALTCKRLYSYMNEEDLWKNKAQNWKNLRVSRGKDATQNLKDYYVRKYQENEKKEEEYRQAAIRNEKKARKEKRIRDAINFFNHTFFDYRVFDIPICICVILWTILMAVRADEYILWNYHVVFIPLYFGYFYVALGCICTFPVSYWAYQSAIYPQYKDNLLSVISKECRLAGYFIVGAPWSISLTFFIIYASAKESFGTFSESYSFIPIFFASTIGLFACFGVCMNSIKRGYGSDEGAIGGFGMLIYFYFGWLFVFLAVKSDYYLDFQWEVAFIPFWITFSGLLIAYIVSAFVLLCSSSMSEKKIFRNVSAFLVPGYFGLVTWFIMLSINLDAQDRDLPMIPWILVDIPIIVMEVAFTSGIGTLMYVVTNM